MSILIYRSKTWWFSFRYSIKCSSVDCKSCLKSDRKIKFFEYCEQNRKNNVCWQKVCGCYFGSDKMEAMILNFEFRRFVLKIWNELNLYEKRKSVCSCADIFIKVSDLLLQNKTTLSCFYLIISHRVNLLL